MMPTTRRPALPLVIIAALFALLVTFALFAIAMQAGVGMLIVFVLAMILMLAFSLFLFRGFAAAGLSIVDKKLEAQREQHRHIEVMAKYNPPQIEAPRELPEQAALPAAPIDPRREHALRLLTATLDSPRYGPSSTRIMPQAEAGKLGIIANDWSAGVEYLYLFGVMTGNQGTLIKEDRTVSRLMADVARGRVDELASAIMALPELGPR